MPPPSTFQRNALMMGILASWAVVTVSPSYANVVLQDAPTNTPPPFSQATTQRILSTWDAPPLPMYPRAYTPQSAQATQADNPPPSSNVTLYTILKTWESLPLPLYPRHYAPQATNIPPPFSQVTTLGILKTWDTLILPLYPRPYTPQIAAVAQADNPPPYSLVTTLNILKSWDTPPLPLYPLRYAPQVLAQADNPPPFSHVTLYQILSTWTPGPPAPLRYPVVLPSSIADSIPYLDRSTLYRILATWHAGPIIPQRRTVVLQSGTDAPIVPPVTDAWVGRRRPHDEPTRKAWPLPPPQFHVEQSPKVLTFGDKPATALKPVWLDTLRRKPRGTYRGLVYRPSIETSAPTPVVRAIQKPVLVPISPIDETQIRRKRQQRQEDDLIIALLMQDAL